MERFAGIGIVNALTLVIFTVLVIVGAKSVLAKYPVNGLSEIIQAV